METNTYKTQNFFLLLLLSVSTLFSYCSTTFNSDNTKSIETKNQRININNSEGDLDRAITNLTDQIISSMIAKGKTKVAVIEFSDLEGNILKFGKYLSEELITGLFRTQRFDVIERRLLNKVLDEQKLSLSDLIDPNSIRELGKILGVDAIVTGTITDLGTSLKVNARIISTETGLVFAVAASDIIKNKTVRNLLISQMAEQEDNKIKIEKKEDKPVIKKRDKSGFIFFKEDFSDISEGNIPDKWIGGESLIVSSDGRQKYITPFESRNHKFSVVDIDFPKNFKFEWILKTPPPGWWEHTAIIGNVKIKIYNNGRSLLMNNTVKDIDNIAGKTIKISLEKYGDVFKLFIDGRQIMITRYPGYRSPKGFSFEFKFPQFRLYNIIGTSLWNIQEYFLKN